MLSSHDAALDLFESDSKKVPQAELVDDSQQESGFSAPANSDLIDRLIGEYNAAKAKIEAVIPMMQSEPFVTAKQYLEIAASRKSHWNSKIPEVDVDMAIAALNSDFWGRALNQTDLLSVMPAKRREEWNSQLENLTTPAFEEDTVRSTLESLLHQRATFFAERVDGVFRALSNTHITNAPEAFGRKMILKGAVDELGLTSHTKIEIIYDLRAVIAKLTQRPEIAPGSTHDIVQDAYRNHLGSWRAYDGGALCLRMYGNGNAHIMVHPEIVWQLNKVLAIMHPAAIPPKHRSAPKQKPKTWPLRHEMLDSETLQALHSMTKSGNRREGVTYQITRMQDTDAVRRVESLMATLGGEEVSPHTFTFSYDPEAAIATVTRSGQLPEHRSHQFFATPDELAEEVALIAEDGATPGMQWLEPSSGTGSLADALPSESELHCCEINPVFCDVLRGKGYTVFQGDFLDTDTLTSDTGFYDRIVMNPPYDKGRWQAHVVAATARLKKGGRLVAILPSSAPSMLALDHMAITWSDVRSDKFEGTGVSVRIMTAERTGW